MVPSKDLFILIHSLNKSEKRYFRLFAARQAGEKNYLKLFDAIDLQEEYDERKVMEEVRHENLSRRFASAKNYLYGLILKSLRGYHENSSVSQEIRSSFSSVYILFSKGMFEQAMKILKSVKKTIDKYQKIAFTPEAILLQKNIMLALGFQKYSLDDISKAHEELKKDAAQFVLQNDYELLSMRIFKAGYHQEVVRNKKQMQKVEKIMEDPLLKDESLATAPGSKQAFYLTHAAYYGISGNLSKQYYYLRKDLGIYQQYSQMVSIASPKRYLTALSNYMECCTSLKKYDEAEKTLAELKKCSTSPEFEKDMLYKSWIFDISFKIGLKMLLKQGEFIKGISQVPDFEQGIKKFGEMIKPDDLLLIYFNISCLYFGGGKYIKAKQWGSKFFNLQALSSKQDLYCIGRMLNLLIHYELGNFDLLEYSVRSTYQLLGRHAKLFKTEKLILDFIKTFLRTSPDKRMLKSMFQKLADTMEGIRNDPYEKLFLEYFDLISWIESKIEGRTFEEEVREKAKDQV